MYAIKILNKAEPLDDVVRPVRDLGEVIEILRAMGFAGADVLDFLAGDTLSPSGTSRKCRLVKTSEEY